MRTFIAVVAVAVLVALAALWRMANPSHEAPPAAHAAAPASAAAQMGPLEASTNRQGRDLSDFGDRVADAAACAHQCAIDDRCMAMSFVKSADAPAGMCWLKGSVPTASANPAVVSAVKIPPGH